MEGTYNTFGKHGSTIDDPPIVVWLESSPDSKYGMLRGDKTPGEVAEWLLMAVKGVEYGELKSERKRRRPVVVADIRGDRRRYDSVTGDEI